MWFVNKKQPAVVAEKASITFSRSDNAKTLPLGLALKGLITFQQADRLTVIATCYPEGIDDLYPKGYKFKPFPNPDGLDQWIRETMEHLPPIPEVQPQQEPISEISPATEAQVPPISEVPPESPIKFNEFGERMMHILGSETKTPHEKKVSLAKCLTAAAQQYTANAYIGHLITDFKYTPGKSDLSISERLKYLEDMAKLGYNHDQLEILRMIGDIKVSDITG